jgi:hypothetical protein
VPWVYSELEAPPYIIQSEHPSLVIGHNSLDFEPQLKLRLNSVFINRRSAAFRSKMYIKIHLMRLR